MGHPATSLVDGGFSALVEAGLAPSTTPSAPTPNTGLPIAPPFAWQIEAEEMLTLMNQPDTVLVDSRELREFQGETPYGESRGGHVPGAVHIHYLDLVDERGLLLERQAMLERLAQLGITPDKRVVAYCTGGIRSAWLTIILLHVGFERVDNYAGSLWQWSARQDYPLRIPQ